MTDDKEKPRKMVVGIAASLPLYDLDDLDEKEAVAAIRRLFADARRTVKKLAADKIPMTAKSWKRVTVLALEVEVEDHRKILQVRAYRTETEAEMQRRLEETAKWQSLKKEERARAFNKLWREFFPEAEPPKLP